MVDHARRPCEARVLESVEATHTSHAVAAQVCSDLKISLPPIRVDGQCKYGLLSEGQVREERGGRSRGGMSGWGEGGEGEGVGSFVTRGRSRMTLDPRSHPYNAGTEHVGVSPTRQTFDLLAPSAKRREVAEVCTRHHSWP